MKMKASTGRKLRYGGMSLALTALIIAVVVIVNVIFTALAQKFMWYGDLTPELLYTISDEALAIIEGGDDDFGTQSPIERVDEIRAENKKYNEENGLTPDSEGYKDENLMINIIFCDDPDVVQSNTSQKYIYHNALELEEHFPDHIQVINYNIIRNPSSVSRFKTTSRSKLYTSSVIVEFGTEYRVHELRSFFKFDNETSTEEPWAYNGEKSLTSSILSVTRAESPVACFTTNHGEEVKDSALWNTLYDAGYDVQTLDLYEQEIPVDCRLIVVFDPQDDFRVTDGISETNEIDKLDAFLDAANSMMVFMDPDAPKLENFEEYLEEWGVAFDRTPISDDRYASHLVTDTSQSLTSDGYTFLAEYTTEAKNPGAVITQDMRSRSTPQSVVFANAMSLSYSDAYQYSHYTPDETATDADDIPFDFAFYDASGTTREIFDVFVTSDKAKTYAGDAANPVELATASDPLKLMTLTVERRNINENNYDSIDAASYVLACGSTEFASEKLLQSNSYGNTDFLLTSLKTMGREPVPVGLMFKPFADYTIDTVTTSDATQFTVVLAVVPLLVSAITGAVILIRRKHR